MDGWITIGTDLETKEFDRKVEELRNKIKNEEGKQKINIDVNAQLEQEQEQVARQAAEIASQYNKAAEEADRLGRVIKTTKVGSPENFFAQQDYDKQVAIIDELNAKLEEVNLKQTKIDEKIAKNNLQYQSSIDKVSVLKAKIDEVNYKNVEKSALKAEAAAKRVEESAKKQQAEFKKVGDSINNMRKGLVGAIGKIGKMAAALFGIRTAFNLIRQASSTLAQYNQQYATDLEYMRFVMAQGLAPILEKVVNLIQTLMVYINYIAQRMFGVNLFAKGSADAFKRAKSDMSGMAKSSKEIKNNLASFDELNVLDSTGDATGAGAGSLAPSMDIGGLQEVEIPEWLQKLGDLLEPIGELTRQVISDFQSMFGELTKSGKDFWKNIEPLMLNVSNLFKSVFNGLANVFSQLGSLFTRLWNQGILPLWNGIVAAWQNWGQPITENVKAALNSIVELFQTLWESFLQPILTNLGQALGWLWTEHILPLWNNLLNFFGELINGILEIWNKTLSPVLNWLVKTFGPTIAGVINVIVNVVSSVVATIADVIDAIVTILTGIVEFVTGVFTGNWQKAWEGVKTIFKGIWDGIVAIVKGAINIVIDFVNGMIGGIEKALNMIVDKVNSLKIVNPFNGEDIWTPNIPRFTFGRIPKLAKGGIVNTPTRAVIGEAGREAVLPLENNTEWMDMLAERLNTRNDNITIRFTGTAAQLVRMLKPEIDKESKRTGRKLITGGAY